jgi:hypothetical protein
MICRNRGIQIITVPSGFWIDGCRFHLYPIVVLTKVYKTKNRSKEEDYMSCRGAGLILPKPNHDGYIVFLYPNGRNKIIPLVQEVFLQGPNERLPDGCGFRNHYLNYRVFDSGDGVLDTQHGIIKIASGGFHDDDLGTEIGKVSKILKKPLPMPNDVYDWDEIYDKYESILN